jgi:fructokinase
METNGLPSFLLLGECVVDLISTEIVDTLEEAKLYQPFAGGEVANLAANLSRLGYQTSLGACVGSDGFGNFLQDHLSQAGVGLEHLQISDQEATTLIPVARQSGTPDFIVYRGADQYLNSTAGLQSTAKECQFIHTSAFALSRNPCRNTILDILKANQGQGKIISLDPNYHPQIWPDLPDFLSTLQDLFQYFTVTKPSLDDSIRIFGPGFQPVEYLEKFLNLGPEIVVLTMGSEGSLLGTARGDKIHIQPNPIPVADITGAGDAFWSGLLAGLSEGYPALTAARLGQVIAEYKIGLIGPIQEHLPLQMYLNQAEITPIKRF